MRALIAPLARALESRTHILIYGPAATGKTHLAHAFFMHAEEAGLRPIIVATEPGTITYVEHVGSLDHVTARTLDEMAKIVAEESLRGRLPIIDSINWHYRESPGLGSARSLAFTASLLYSHGGVSTAQVAGEGRLPSGAPFILPYAGLLAETRRREGRFELIIIRPVRRTAVFQPDPKVGVIWK
ncbi:MAG: hypothetical protein F7C34_05345 [Desulfurococcales archaeon]|nr:hypothetical protein [Desulfurococcales archaeon]